MSDNQELQRLREIMQRLLEEVRDVPPGETDEVFCDEILEEDLLARYLEVELRGEKPAAAYPAVAYHLSVCDDCRDELAMMRNLAEQGTAPLRTDNAPSGINWSKRLPPRKPGQPSLPQIISQWRESLGSARKMVRRGTRQAAPLSVDLPGLPSPVLLEVSVNTATRALRGSILCDGADLGGATMRLYKISPASVMDTADVEADGFFLFSAAISPNRYILSLVLPDDAEYPLAIIEHTLWEI